MFYNFKTNEAVRCEVDASRPAKKKRVISRIYRNGMTTTSGVDISILDENGDIWVTPSALEKGSLTESGIVCVKKDRIIIGKHKPSSEFPFHKAI